MGFLSSIWGFIMTPLYWVVSLVLSGFHHFFSLVGLGNSGIGWALSIVGLTATIRAALIPLFVKQIKASRNMQLLQPKVKELQKKYGHDRERLAQETMNLYKESGTNPLASCLPLLLQMPIFLALYRVIRSAAGGEGIGALTQDQATALQTAHLFGAKIADSFTHATTTNVKVLAGVLVVAMIATQFLTQRQLMAKNMPADAMSGQYAQQQKMLLYVLPPMFAFMGVAFPIGVLIYWTTSNLWSMGQQFYVIRRNPAPGTPAFEAKEARDAHRAARHGRPVEGSTGTVTEVEDEAPAPQQRQQPKKQSRSQRKGQQRKPGK